MVRPASPRTSEVQSGGDTWVDVDAGYPDIGAGSARGTLQMPAVEPYTAAPRVATPRITVERDSNTRRLRYPRADVVVSLAGGFAESAILQVPPIPAVPVLRSLKSDFKVLITAVTLTLTIIVIYF